MMRRWASAIALASLVGVAPARAAEVGVDALTVLPRGELNENLDPAYGIGLQMLWPMKDTPLLLGAEAAFARYGEKRRNLFGDLDVVTSNEIGSLHAVLRLQAASGKVRPYLDALAGYKWFQTESTVVVDDCFLCDDEEIDSDVELRDSAFSYGFGAGLRIKLGESDVFFDTKVRYLRGHDATYLTRGSIDDANLGARLRESATDAWSIHIGVSLRL